MDISEKKRQIVERINNIQEEWLIKAIEKLLDIDDDNETPDWHICPVLK
ncbi:MAG: hypothetical protein JST83_17310 [Bacteroidetes bacterium]|nr:hypothetical protein [Bacteroidota bacterium]